MGSKPVRAETALAGSVHESPTPKGDAQNPGVKNNGNVILSRGIFAARKVNSRQS
jgi:hypothetical protein